MSCLQWRLHVGNTTSASRPRRPWECFAQRSAACGVMQPLKLGATSSWIGAASSLACSHPPPAQRVWVATPILTSRSATSSTPSSRTPGAVFTPVRGGRTGTSTLGISFLRFCFRVHLLALLLDGPYGEEAMLLDVNAVPRVAPATLGAGAGGGAPPSSSPSHFTEHDIYDQELGRPMRVKG